MPTTTVDKEELCQKIRSLPEDLTVAVSDFVDCLIEDDEEPLSRDELAQIEASKADIAAGNVYTLEEFNRRMDALQ